MSEGAWTAVATLDDFAASDAIFVVAAGKEIAIFLVDGTVFATANRCTHGDARLCDGWVEGHEIECPLHQGRFDVRNGKALCAPLDEDLKTYPVKIEGGRVYLALG